eukprot:gene26427-33005_t
MSHQIDYLVSERTIRDMFSPFGEVLDVTIKEHHVNEHKRIQNGYGFVHFAKTYGGIHSACQSVETMHSTFIDRRVYIDCQLSHHLEKYIKEERLNVAAFYTDQAGVFCGPLTYAVSVGGGRHREVICRRQVDGSEYWQWRPESRCSLPPLESSFPDDTLYQDYVAFATHTLVPRELRVNPNAVRQYVYEGLVRFHQAHRLEQSAWPGSQSPFRYAPETMHVESRSQEVHAAHNSALATTPGFCSMHYRGSKSGSPMTLSSDIALFSTSEESDSLSPPASHSSCWSPPASIEARFTFSGKIQWGFATESDGDGGIDAETTADAGSTFPPAQPGSAALQFTIPRTPPPLEEVRKRLAFVGDDKCSKVTGAPHTPSLRKMPALVKIGEVNTSLVEKVVCSLVNTAEL